MIQDLGERIQAIEEEIRETPHHKGTEHHIGKLRAKLAKLKDDQLKEGGKKGGGGGFAVRKTGDATVVLVGPPSVGKSTLINKLTRADSKVAAYDFTTVTVVPGMMEYQGAKIQIFDIPGLIADAAKGRGGGKEVIASVRAADLLLLVVESNDLGTIEKIKKELYAAGIRLDEEPPAVLINKKQRGGLKVLSTVRLSLDRETIKKVAKEFGLENVEMVIRENITLERLIDVLSGNRVYLPYFILVSKIDKLSLEELEKTKDKFRDQSRVIFVSCHKNFGLEDLKEMVWEELGLIRVCLKRGKEVDFDQPFILRSGESFKDLLERISICEKETFKAARIYGSGAKYPGQEVSLNFQPQDEEIVSFF